jgi:hypothetical protein
MRNLFILFISVLLMLFVVSCNKDSAIEKKQADKALTEKEVKTPTYVTMPESTAIAIIFVDSIDTDIHETGMEFRAKLFLPIVVNGYTLFDQGAAVRGVLNKVVESGRLKTPAELIYSLTAIQDKSGQWIDINTYAIQQEKGSHTNREVAMIGGGAIVGGIIGKIVNKKGSTEIGAATGAAAGLVAADATGKKDIVHSVGTGAVFYLRQPTQVALK